MKKKAISGGRRAYILTMRILMGAAAVITAALVLFLIAYVLIKGLPNVSWTLLSTAPSYLADRIGIVPERTVAFGDSLNDKSLLAFTPNSVAMANATEGVKAAADFVTTSCDEDGVAVALEKFVL